MSIELPALFAQEYSDKFGLLLQQTSSKLRPTVLDGEHVGKAATVTDQYGVVEMQPVASRFCPMGHVNSATDRRWISPSDFDLPQLIDSFDKLRLINDPMASYAKTAVMAAGRQFDNIILKAFTAFADTGEVGGIPTPFDTANKIDVAIGGANSRLNVAKLKALKQAMMSKHIDFDTEQVFIGITAKDHTALFDEIQVISNDFNSEPVLVDGKISQFLGFNLVHCELIETVMAGTNEVTLPAWVKSGMYFGLWADIENSISQRNDLQGEPWQIYTKLSAGATRLEEAKVYAVKSYRS